MTTSVRVRTAGATLAVHLRGEGVAVLFVHGFPLDHTMWTHQLASLSGRRGIAPDLRGAGVSEAPADGYTMARYADDLVAVLDALDVRQAVCCGFSMGGYILFELMRRHPERIGGLILCDTRPEPDSVEGKRGRDDLAALAQRAGMGPVADRLLPKLVGATTRARDPALVEVVRAMLLRSPVAGVVGALRAMRDRPDSTPLLGSIAVPTLVVGGAEDELTPPGVVRAMAERIRGARWEEIAGAGHLAPLERPEAVDQALKGFLTAL